MAKPTEVVLWALFNGKSRDMQGELKLEMPAWVASAASVRTSC